MNDDLSTTTVICPFLASLLNEGDLEMKSVHTAQELADVTVLAGLSNATVQGHVFDGNFRDIPTLEMNIFDMEGAVNEHLSSTGISDCPSNFPVEGAANCEDDNITGALRCPTPNPNCTSNSEFISKKFDTFLRIADSNSDGYLEINELMSAEAEYNNVERDDLITDFNLGRHLQPPNPVEGTITCAFSLFI